MHCQYGNNCLIFKELESVASEEQKARVEAKQAALAYADKADKFSTELDMITVRFEQVWNF